MVSYDAVGIGIGVLFVLGSLIIRVVSKQPLFTDPVRAALPLLYGYMMTSGVLLLYYSLVESLPFGIGIKDLKTSIGFGGAILIFYGINECRKYIKAD